MSQHHTFCQERYIGEDSAASHLPSGEKDANLDDTSSLRKSKKSRLNTIPDPHFHEEVQDDANVEEKKKAVEKIREVREDDGEKRRNWRLTSKNLFHLK